MKEDGERKVENDDHVSIVLLINTRTTALYNPNLILARAFSVILFFYFSVSLFYRSSSFRFILVPRASSAFSPTLEYFHSGLDEVQGKARHDPEHVHDPEIPPGRGRDGTERNSEDGKEGGEGEGGRCRSYEHRDPKGRCTHPSDLVPVLERTCIDEGVRLRYRNRVVGVKHARQYEHTHTEHTHVRKRAASFSACPSKHT